MITIISRKRKKKLLLIEKLFLNPISNKTSYEELVLLHDKKLEEIKDIRIRLKNIRQTFTTLLKTNGRTLRQYKKNSK